MSVPILLAAALTLAPFDDPHVRLQAPKGWTVKLDWDHGKIEIARSPSQPGAAIELTCAIGPHALTERTLRDALGAAAKGAQAAEVDSRSFLADVVGPKGPVRLAG